MLTLGKVRSQARKVLEEIHRIGLEEKAGPLKMRPPKRFTFIRSGFYTDIQSLLLQQVMK